jgi:DNA-binding MarR family transcriptional regulator
MADLVDQLLEGWAEQRPEQDFSALGIVVRIQLLSKLMTESAERALGQLGLKLWEYDVLSALRRQGRPYEMSASELAQASMLTSGTVTTRIDGLEDRGFVERMSSPDDRRAVNIQLTREGRDLIDQAIGARLSSAEAQLDRLSKQERVSVSTALRKLLTDLAI